MRVGRAWLEDTEQPSVDEAISKALRCHKNADGVLPPISVEELNTNISELEKHLNGEMVCFAGKYHVYIQSLILGGGKTSKPRIALKCALREQFRPPPDVYYEYVRDVCCGNPTVCPAYQAFRARRSV